MKTKFASLLVAVFAAAAMQAAEVPAIITISNDNQEGKYQLASVQQITFSEGSMTVVRKNDAGNVSNVRCVKFGATIDDSESQTPTEIAALEGADLFVYPNPVAQTLRIDGAEAGSTFTIYDLQGRTLMQTIENQIDVSSLAQGSYLLKVNDQVVKFIKK